MFFITFHGGDGGVNNIYAYDDGGNLLNPANPGILSVNKPNDLSELRGFYFQNDYLYVTNGGKKVNNILCFKGSATSYKKVSHFVDGDGNAQGVTSINHPFAMAFDGSGHCYVSNQDSDVVAILNVASDYQTATAGTLPQYLTLKPFDKGTFLAGTFVASSSGSLPNVPGTTPVPISMGGLDVAIVEGKVQNSVRDVALSGGILYVADEPGNVIRLYDPATGTPLGISSRVIGPVHMLLRGNVIHVSAGTQILSGTCPTAPVSSASATNVCLTLTPLITGLPGQASGMTVDPENNFYVAIRTSTPQILKYASLPGTPTVFNQQTLSDAPEFIAYVPN